MLRTKFRGSPSAILRWLLVVGAIALPIGGLASIGLQAASADTYCAESTPDSGVAGGVVYDNWILVYTNGSCSGTRQVRYEMYSTASTATYMDVDSARAWVCGTLSGPYSPTPAVTTQTLVTTDWSPSNSCGFQADQSTYFGGAVNKWTYSNI